MNEDDLTESRHLAGLILLTLDAQQVYFKTRDKKALIYSKDLEKKLRAAAVAVMESKP